MTRGISVSLPSAIVYVTGTVNDVEYTWTLIDTYWRAVVERAIDEIYVISITAITSSGNSKTFDFTLNYGSLNLVTDRTQEDVNAVVSALERIKSGTGTAADLALLSSNKGSYNHTDLNRVGAAVAQVAAELREYGYNAAVLGKSNWEESDIPTRADIDRYLADIAAIRAAIPVGNGTPLVPAIPLDFAKANDIEQILIDVYNLIRSIEKTWNFAGELFSGER